jgi:hypothetical protein
VNISQLSDAELWEAIAVNAEAMATVARHATMTASPGNPAFAAARERRWAALELEHDDYSAELKRRFRK